MQTNRLVFCDLETTGLDPDRDTILELGMIITDRELREIARASWVLGDGVLDPSWYTAPEVYEMHRSSGLIEECRASELEIADVDRLATEFVRQHDAAGSPMCGSSVHFDRKFLAHTELTKALHYRNFDATMFRIAADLVGVEIPLDKRGRHRALDDLEDSIALARWGLARFQGGI